MPVNVETPIATSTANGVTTVFPYNFTVLQASDLVVTSTSPSGIVTTYTNGVDYTVSGVGTGTGSATFIVAPANGLIITRYRNSMLSRSTDYQQNGDLLSDTIDNDFDRIWMVLQEQQRSVAQFIRVPEAAGIPVLGAAAARANLLLGFDSSGNPVPVAAVAGTSTALSLNLANIANGFGADLIAGVGRVCDTIAAVQALAVNKAGGSQRAFALGYSVLGGHGGGQFYWVSGDVTPVNTGTCFASTSGGVGRWRRVSLTGALYITDFGAVMDGVTDDTAAANAMLAAITNPAQQTGNIPPGVTKLSNIIVPAGVVFRGDSEFSTTVNITDLVHSAFYCNTNTEVLGFQINYPNQVVTGVPTVYPPAFTLAAGGASYFRVHNIRVIQCYSFCEFGDATNGCGGIEVYGCVGFPLKNGVKIDSCNETCHIHDNYFNAAVVGSLYPGNVIPGWVLQNGIAFDIRRCDSYTVTNNLALGYLNFAKIEAGVSTGSANMGTLTDNIVDLCNVPFNVVNYQDGLVIKGGSITGCNGYLSITGGPMTISGGIAANQQVVFDDVIIRNFYLDPFLFTTNFVVNNCQIYSYNNHNAAPLGGISIGVNGLTGKVTNNMFDGSSRANTRGIDNQNAFTGVQLVISGNTFQNLGSNCIFAPVGTAANFGPNFGTASTGIFYHGITCVQNSQGQLATAAIPAAGTHAVGDIFYSSAAPVAAAAVGWICSAAPLTFLKIGVYS